MPQLQARAGVFMKQVYTATAPEGVGGVIHFHEFTITPLDENRLLVELDGCTGMVHLVIKADQARELGKALIEAADPRRN
jgi:hypothetical protein